MFRDFSGMFDRKLRDEVNGIIISSIKAEDRDYKNYETAIVVSQHKIKVVELYENEVEMAIGHEKWVKEVGSKDFDYDKYEEVFADYVLY